MIWKFSWIKIRMHATDMDVTIACGYQNMCGEGDKVTIHRKNIEILSSATFGSYFITYSVQLPACISIHVISHTWIFTLVTSNQRYICCIKYIFVLLYLVAYILPLAYIGHHHCLPFIRNQIRCQKILFFEDK